MINRHEIYDLRFAYHVQCKILDFIGVIAINQIESLTDSRTLINK